MERIAEIDQLLGDLRVHWMAASEGEKSRWMEIINGQLDARNRISRNFRAAKRILK